MALTDEVRMDRSAISVVKTGDPSDAREYWRSKTVQERLAALELTVDMDVWVAPDTENRARVIAAIREFWIGETRSRRSAGVAGT